MTSEQIEELFISAAETDSRLPDTARPARLKAQAMPYYHTKGDVDGWGGERYQQERSDFLSALSTRVRNADVSRWELCNELIAFVPRDRDRRCLWAWAASEAKVLRVATQAVTVANMQPKFDGKVVPTISTDTRLKRISFSRWCRDVEGIHRNTGSNRKDVAVSCIASIFLRNTLADIRKLQKRTLQDAPESAINVSTSEKNGNGPGWTETHSQASIRRPAGSTQTRPETNSAASARPRSGRRHSRSGSGQPKWANEGTRKSSAKLCRSRHPDTRPLVHTEQKPRRNQPRSPGRNVGNGWLLGSVAERLNAAGC